MKYQKLLPPLSGGKRSDFFYFYCINFHLSTNINNNISNDIVCMMHFIQNKN